MDDPNATTDEVRAGRVLGQTSAEVGLFAAPILIVALIGAFVWRPAVFWLAICEWAGLSLGLGGSRATERITLVRWPHPSSTLDKVTTVIAYNGVLGLALPVGIVAWLATRWFIIGVTAAVVLPVWLLKHIRFLLALSEPK